MQKAIVVIVAMLSFAAPVVLTLATNSSGGFSPAEDVKPRDLPGKILFFSASWCPACRHADPAYQELRNAGYPIRKVDVDSNSSLAQKYGVRSIPQFVYVVNGQEKSRISGGASAGRIKRLYRGGW
ncbi:thioredoxin family protein [Bremerella sp.]|uniref:thioredoxin family protein n=1 Tax=Bremerella sp. TaxID=2795602 RepID=UPI00391B9A21